MTQPDAPQATQTLDPPEDTSDSPEAATGDLDVDTASLADPVETLRNILDALGYVDTDVDDRQQLVDRWVLAKQAANKAYAICSELGQRLLAQTDSETGFVASVSQRKIQVARRFELEVLGAAGEADFAEWCEAEGVEPFEVKLAVSDEAKKLVKHAVLDMGEKVPGVSAGYGAPYLSLGR